ncbi:hypothetical protein [Parasphingorhabdus sp.]|uniref:hypothetical protein n=1 Tax=Parasphingorhabdus sp. TaxID=2709688 RepID=UPI003A93015E
MSIRNIPLRKLLQLMYADDRLRTSKLREDIRNTIARDSGIESGGPDFYSPFWYSAKNHVFGTNDLHTDVEEHIATNYRRARLYPRLRDGFLLWWNERRRWTNEPFVPADALSGVYPNEALDVTVKVNNILSVRDGTEEEHFMYPYFCPEPVLSLEAARIGLWIMRNTFPNVPEDDLRILDVIRGENYSIGRVQMLGDEQRIFEARFQWLLNEWDRLRLEYD